MSFMPVSVALSICFFLVIPDPSNEKDTMQNYFKPLNGSDSRLYRSKSKKVDCDDPRGDPEIEPWKFPIKVKFCDLKNADRYECHADRSNELDRFKRKIKEALAYVQDHTCIRFSESDSGNSNRYIHFFLKSGRHEECFSDCGMMSDSPTGVFLTMKCLNGRVVEHEIMHALGWTHTTMRLDRNEFIVAEQRHNPADCSLTIPKKNKITNVGEYDFGSIMHYGIGADTNKPDLFDVTPLNKYFAGAMGQQKDLSFYDKWKLNQVYCKDKCPGFVGTCQNKGFMHPNRCDKCICPLGYMGDKCEKFQISEKNSCAHRLTASESLQDIQIPDQNGECLWIISASVGSRIYVTANITRVGGLCKRYDNCKESYVEIRTTSDLANSGVRLCCEEKYRGTSEKSQVLIHLYGSWSKKERQNTFKIQYKLA